MARQGDPGQAATAVTAFRRVVELEPRSAPDRVSLALALLQVDDVDGAARELTKATELDSGSADAWFHLAALEERRGAVDRAIEHLESALRLASAGQARSQGWAHLELGRLRAAAGAIDQAFGHYETAAQVVPEWPAPHLRLAELHAREDRPLDADREQARFEELAAQAPGGAAEGTTLDLRIDATPDPRDLTTVPVPPLPNFVPRTLAQGFDIASARLFPIDSGGSGRADLLAISTAGIQLFAQGREPLVSGLEDVKGHVTAGIGDFDDDSLPDLCLVDEFGIPSLWRNVGGRFEAIELAIPRGPFRQALWLDVDDDGDLDLALLGRRSTVLYNTPPDLLIDRGDSEFPFVEGQIRAATLLDMDRDRGGMDLATVYNARRGVLYHDGQRLGYEARLLLNVPIALTEIINHDADHDGWADLTVANASMAVLFLNDHSGGFRRSTAPPKAKAPILWADLTGRGVPDLITGGGIFRNRGLGRLMPEQRPPGWPTRLAAAAATDFDADGRIDVAAVDGDGNLLLLRNTGDHPAGLRVALKNAEGWSSTDAAVVEVWAGALHQRRRYEGLPLVFGLGGRPEADVVRVTWPRQGEVTTEWRVHVAPGDLVIVEPTG